MLDSLLDHITTEMTEETTLVVDEQRYQKQVNELNDLKDSDHWLSLFVRSHSLSSNRGIESEFLLPIDDKIAVRVELWKKIGKVSVENAANSDEIAMLYFYLPGLVIHDSHVGTSFIRAKNSVTVALMEKGDGMSVSLTIIGKTTKPRSFPRHCYGSKDMRLFSLAERNARSTQTIWTSIVQTFDDDAPVRRR